MRPKDITSMPPFVSVIMPVRNEAMFIEKSLGALFRQDYPSDRMEIIVADGMSIDSTRQLINRFAEKSGRVVRIVDNPQRIAPAGLNAGLKKAVGEIIVRVDGHCEVMRDYVSNCVALLVSGKADGVGGPIETVGATPRAAAIALAMSSKFGVGGSAFRTVHDRESYTDTVAFPGYTRKIIERVGLFNEELVRNQDDEYNFRIRKAGGRILLSPKIRSRYYSRSTLSSLARQYFQYGYWKVRVLQIHPRQMSVRQLVPSVFVLSLISLLIVGSVWDVGRWGLLSLVTCYVVANLTATIETAKNDLKLAPILAIAYSIIHVSYGLGFLCGLVAFINRWGNRPSIEGLPSES